MGPVTKTTAEIHRTGRAGAGQARSVDRRFGQWEVPLVRGSRLARPRPW